MSITRSSFGLSTDGLRRTGQLSSATCCKSLHCLRCPQMLKTVIHISTASDFQQSVPFRAPVGRRKFPKTFFGFPRKPYIPGSGWIFQMRGGGSFHLFSSVINRLADRLSTVFHHLLHHLFGDLAVALLDHRMGGGRRASRVAALHDRLYDGYFA